MASEAGTWWDITIPEQWTRQVAKYGDWFSDSMASRVCTTMPKKHSPKATRSVTAGLSFPVANGYVSVLRLALEAEFGAAGYGIYEATQ